MIFFSAVFKFANIVCHILVPVPYGLGEEEETAKGKEVAVEGIELEEVATPTDEK